MPPDDSNFFEHVKRHLENRDLYNEFLKVVNLFTQEYIDMATLVKESRHFLGDSELYKQFKDILGWDDRRERQQNLAAQQSSVEFQKAKVVSLIERPGKINYFEKFGSYRKVPAEVSRDTLGLC
jgi:paired amphipathic helix protein Sin3a